MSGNVGGEGCDVNLTPLLDLVLQLIMFFMITINFVRADQFEQGITLPMSSSATPLDNDANAYIFLNLKPSKNYPHWELGGNLQGFDLNTPGKIRSYLEHRRTELKKDKPDAKIVVILRADQDIRYSTVWRVLDSCKTAGFVHWQLRVMTGGKK